MDQPPDLLPFLDRRLKQKETPVTEPKKKREPKERKAVLRLVVEYDHATHIMLAAKELIEKAKESGTVKLAKLSGLPTTTDLA